MNHNLTGLYSISYSELNYLSVMSEKSRYESQSKLNPYKVKLMSDILSTILFKTVDIKKDDRDQRPVLIISFVTEML